MAHFDDRENERCSVEKCSQHNDPNTTAKVQNPKIQLAKDESSMKEAAIRFDTVKFVDTQQDAVEEECKLNEQNVGEPKFDHQKKEEITTSENISNDFRESQPSNRNENQQNKLDGTQVETRMRNAMRSKFSFLNESEQLTVSEPAKRNLDVPNDCMQLNIDDETIQVGIEEIETVKHLGEGGFSPVNMVKIKSRPGVRMALKHITLYDTRADATRTELTTIRKVGTGKCRNIIKYYGAMIDSNNGELCIALEWMDTTMKEFYKTMHHMRAIRANNLDQFLTRLIRDIVTALDFMASENILYRDIKPANILINKKCIFKLCDFGICCEMNGTNLVENDIQGTSGYLPPLIHDKPSNKRIIQADLWALFVTLNEIILGNHPCVGVNHFDQTLKMISWKPELTTTDVSDDMKKFLIDFFTKYRAGQYISYEEILAMPFIQNLPEEPSIEECKFIESVIDMSH